MLDASKAKLLSKEQRKEVFLAVVSAQDGKMSVAESRRFVAERFNISEMQVAENRRGRAEPRLAALG
jgi:hypothetical protein